MMARTLLRRSSINVGRRSGILDAAPNYTRRENRMTHSRLLYHSGLDDLIVYPQVPTKTLNFSLDLMPRVEWVESKTLTSNLTQQWEAVYDDVIIKEIFEGGITQQQSFLLPVYRHWVTLFGSYEYGLWRPLDLTDKVYRVKIVNLLVGGEEFNPTYVGRSMPDKWLTETIEIWLKLMPAFAPSAVVYASGGLGVS